MAAEFAPGIPVDRKVEKIPHISAPKTLEFGIHKHFSEGAAGTHFDLRIGDSETGHAHSWALKHLPAPGEKRLAIQQPTHTLPYMSWQGRIESGYGKGNVELARRDKTEVLHTSDDLVRFNIYSGKNNEEYALRRLKTGKPEWLLQNLTASRFSGPSQNLPSSKPAYKSIEPEKLDIHDASTELQAKIDGAHVLFSFASSTPKVFSYRPTERATGIIEHTHKLEGFHARKTPASLKDTVLRGELYATDDSGKALPAARVGGLLNAGVWKSREKQEQEGKLVPVVFDVVRWRGKNVEDAPYSQKKELLAKAIAEAPWLKLPRTASTPAAKQKLIEDIKTGKEPSTEEGVIEWDYAKSTPRKSKFLEEKDVFVRSVFPEVSQKRQGLAGGFEFSLKPEGPIIGRVGTGMSHAMKRDMLSNPSKYEGLSARIKTMKVPEHYAPRAPSFLAFHLDQDLPEGVKTADDKPKAFYRGQAVPLDTVKFKTEFQGIPIHIDRPKGLIMTGRDHKGKAWSRRYLYDYGFIPKTAGGDGDGLDVFIGPNKKAKEAYWATQKKEDGSFDEWKLFVGFDNRDAAITAYRAHIPKKLLVSMIALKPAMIKSLIGLDPDHDLKKTAALGFVDELGWMGQVRL